MNVADMMAALVRRWYVLVAGLLIVVGATYMTWSSVHVEYTRTATQLMLPGSGTIPDGANPFLYVGGLSQAADVLVRKMGSREVLAEVEAEYPDVDIVISRDPLSSGPVVLATVMSSSDAHAGAVINRMIALTDSTLLDIQSGERIPRSEQITLVTLTVDTEGVVEQKNRLVAAGVVAAGGIGLTCLIVALVDGLARSRAYRRGRRSTTSATADERDEQDQSGRLKGPIDSAAAVYPVVSDEDSNRSDLGETETDSVAFVSTNGKRS